MFEHLRMCIIHQIVPTQFNRQFLQKNIFAPILRVCKFSARGLGWRNMWDPPVGGGWVGGHVWWCKQRDRPARHPATHLLIFSDEDFYLRLILYSFQPACIVSLQPPSPFPRQPGWSQPCRQHGWLHLITCLVQLLLGFWLIFGSCLLKDVNSLPTFLPCLEKLSNSSERQRNPCSLATSGQLRIYRGIPICSQTKACVPTQVLGHRPRQNGFYIA